MQFLIDFLETKEITETKIFEQLKCSVEEAEILRHITRKHIKGNEENSVFLILDELFSTEGYDYILKLPLVKNLLDLGWIVQSSFAQVKTEEVSQIELVNATVMLSKSFERLLEEGSLEVELPQSSPYTDHLEYLRDQFHRIELYQKISTIRHNYKKRSLSIERLEKSLKML
ncbi:MAG TPA: AAA family ATPase, partial [Campylobacteraceae bacterium]|nr:AAA family ATPase [Campylobacteraceae bacterium]